MKPPPFTYHAPRSLQEALSTLAEVGEQAKVLAGGQSLLPVLSMRLAAPEHVVDINRVDEDLGSIRVESGGVRIGALARQAQLEKHSNAIEAIPLLGQALRHVAHPVIRNRGTIVGSLAHADPSAELPAVLALLGGHVVLEMKGGSRTADAAEFFLSPLESDVRPGEMATAAFFPFLPAGTGTAFLEIARRHGDYALSGVTAAVTVDPDRHVRSARTAYVSMGPTPVVLDLTDTVAGPVDTADWTAAADAAVDQLEPDTDIHASADYRRHLARVLTRRGLAEAAEAAG